jgi:fructoselysine-6-P-deglycase FrlB-like protein
LEPGLLSTLDRESVVILASGKRPWRTRNERLAESLRRAGHKVVLVSTSKEAKDA